MNSNEIKRRGAPAVEIGAFANRKGVVKGLQTFRKRKEKKRIQTSKALREYERVMKQEGYEAGKGASRRRDDRTRNRSKEKTNPYQAATAKAEQRKEEAVKKQQSHEEGEKRRKQKLQERRQRTRLLSKKTRRGQPIMKNVVHDILHKLESKER